MRRAVLWSLVLALAFWGGATAAGSGAIGTASAQNRVVQVQYVPTRRAQIAIWVETSDGRFLRTLALTQAVAYRGIGNRPGASQMNSGFRWPYGRREGVLPVWAHRRASAPGALLFRRVIFQDRISEGHASRSSNDFSRDDYFCLSFRSETTTRDALDAVTCASTFHSDKGRFVTEADLALQYHEPVELVPGMPMERRLDLYSLYPPRRDVTRCTASGCYDHPDVDAFDAEVRRVMPDIDAITMATPPEGSLQTLMFTWPREWEDGEYVLWIEINTEGDYNDRWGPDEYPTPRNPDPGGTTYREYWDYWAMTYGYPYRGQPSVVYQVPFRVGPGSDHRQVSEPAGYGSLHGWGTGAGQMHTMDGTITDDPATAAGSGADRLLLQEDGWRVRMTVIGPEVCEENVAPGSIEELAITPYHERRDAHRYAHLSFLAPEEDLGIVRYEVRVATHPIEDEATFMRALPANAATIDSVALEVPTRARPGERIEVDMGGLVPETHYWIGVRAIDLCNAAGPIAVAEYTTPPIRFTTVSPCFVATAAWGTPMAAEVAVLRRFRDRHLRSHAIGRALVAAYQSIGPVLAGAIRDDEQARAVARAALAPIVEIARLLDGWVDAERRGSARRGE